MIKLEKKEIKANQKRDKKVKKYINKIVNLGEFDMVNCRTEINMDPVIHYHDKQFAANKGSGVIRFDFVLGPPKEIK